MTLSEPLIREHGIVLICTLFCISNNLLGGSRLAAVIETAKTGDVFNAPVGITPKVLLANMLGLI